MLEKSIEEKIELVLDHKFSGSCYLVTIFDHILSEPETEGKVFSYPVVVSENDRAGLSTYLLQEEQFMNVFKELNNANIKKIHISLVEDVYEYDEINDLEFIDLARKALREEGNHNFYFPGFDILLTGGSDLTMNLFKFTARLPVEFKAIVDKSKIHLLDVTCTTADEQFKNIGP